MVGLSIVAVVFVVEVGDVAICCFVLVLWLEDVQLLHEELLLVLYLSQVRSGRIVARCCGDFCIMLCFAQSSCVRVCSRFCSGSRRSRDIAGYSLGCC